LRTRDLLTLLISGDEAVINKSVGIPFSGNSIPIFLHKGIDQGIWFGKFYIATCKCPISLFTDIRMPFFPLL
jgi:hypothetical protein